MTLTLSSELHSGGNGVDGSSRTENGLLYSKDIITVIRDFDCGPVRGIDVSISRCRAGRICDDFPEALGKQIMNGAAG